MTERNRQTVGIVAQFTLALSVIGLAGTIAVGIWRASAMFTTVKVEHEQIFQMIREKCK